MSRKPKYIAFYLPQYHSIPENDEWWGKGFTEWTSVRNAKSYYSGHKQPIKPGSFGYYNLLNSNILKIQSDLAKSNGLTGFAFYHYWFGNQKLLLEKPAEIYMQDTSIEFPFCFCWANQTWSRTWYGHKDEILIKQTYPGLFDIEKHVEYLYPFFSHSKYLKINDKPVFIIYSEKSIPNFDSYLDNYQNILYKKYGINLYLITGNLDRNIITNKGIVDARIMNMFSEILAEINLKFWNRVLHKIDVFKFNRPHCYDYKEILSIYSSYLQKYSNYIPLVLPNYDDTPRRLKDGVVLQNTHIDLFKSMVDMAKKHTLARNEDDFIFIKSWNEWSEGNYLEPNEDNKTPFLKVFKDN